MYDIIQAKILPLHAMATPRVGSKGQKNFFSKNGHVAYQIKRNDTYKNMQAIILTLHTFSTHWVGVKTVFFSRKRL